MAPARALVPALLALVVLATALASAARAAEWGLITPGKTTMAAVRARYGTATRVDRLKIEGFDTQTWVYEGEHAPTGVQRLTVEFGLKDAGGYRGEVVRDFKIEPRPGTFNRGIIMSGWGPPDKIGRDNDRDVFLYQEGLLVYFDPEGWNASLLVFTLPQPERAEDAAKPKP
ncbi:MAG TPA: hypothetical protein VGR82_04560 [Methylomirabilota bacterium]|jgi:hypothetical protein|nr:hypothetical protein [Methylomirabilota bacterium]HEV8617817.1 hypothetical protein [Methylomirabilota bacterium]